MEKNEITLAVRHFPTRQEWTEYSGDVYRDDVCIWWTIQKTQLPVILTLIKAAEKLASYGVFSLRLGQVETKWVDRTDGGFQYAVKELGEYPLVFSALPIGRGAAYMRVTSMGLGLTSSLGEDTYQIRRSKLEEALRGLSPTPVP